MNSSHIILAIESSCDETSASVIQGNQVLSNIISSQTFHSTYGGVIPELASRAHLRSISLVVHQALHTSGIGINNVHAIAVTNQPGLSGALLVGVSFAKGMALRLGIPIIPVDHIEGHLYSGCMEYPDVQFPCISLVVSGGHTSIFLVHSYNAYELLGSTKDDAAGEAFDKIGKMLHLDYPAGQKIDSLAQLGNPKAYDFPRSMLHDGSYNFSFSGLKTSVKIFLQKQFKNQKPNQSELQDICASVQMAIIEVLTKKTIKAAKAYNVKWIIVSGGVSANSGLRALLYKECKKLGIQTAIPSVDLCTDNAAMIGFLAGKKLAIHGNDPYKTFQFTVNSSALRANNQLNNIQNV